MVSLWVLVGAVLSRGASLQPRRECPPLLPAHLQYSESRDRLCRHWINPESLRDHVRLPIRGPAWCVAGEAGNHEQDFFWTAGLQDPQSLLKAGLRRQGSTLRISQ